MSYKNVIVGSGLKGSIEHFKYAGHPKRQSYKLTEDGRYGNLIIDINKLYGFNWLIAKKDSKIVIDQKVDDDFIELIIKRYNSKKTYSTESENLVRDLTELSGLPVCKTSSKFNKIIKTCNPKAPKKENNTIEYYNDPTE